jgi:hypothetical protein
MSLLKSGVTVRFILSVLDSGGTGWKLAKNRDFTNNASDLDDWNAPTRLRMRSSSRIKMRVYGQQQLPESGSARIGEGT